MGEELDQHLDDVLVGVVVVIEKNDVKKGRELIALQLLGIRKNGGTSHRQSVSNLNGKMRGKGGATDSTGLHLAWEVVPGSELP